MNSQPGGEDREPITREIPVQGGPGWAEEPAPRVSPGREPKADPVAVGAYDPEGDAPRRPRYESSNASMVVAIAAMLIILVVVGAVAWIFLFSSRGEGEGEPLAVADTSTSSTTTVTSTVRTTARSVLPRPTASSSAPPTSDRPTSTSSPSPSSTSPTSAPTSTSSQPPTSEPASAARPTDPDLPEAASPVNSAARSGRSAGSFSQVWSSGATSDDFAQVVRQEWWKAYQETGQTDQTVRAYSPATQRSYEMTCRDTGEYIHCTGGNNANVYIA
ncbi:hypothetical protein MHT86_05455 [Corynebacterium mastitidis]|uniref:Uncharacterized protein n=1 Tax=Corynebacterium mastitidis TaxID=161890 RepID=A0A2N0X7F6_9CORY|nr:hypothetical protein [Corynebacterium mastitidis]MCH6196942.1 hypothetical protein [Corynebacterium mastitidis]PKF68619.1 hypothetical protein CXB45_06325 [Corynebacterium mastitidis]